MPSDFKYDYGTLNKFKKLYKVSIITGKTEHLALIKQPNK